MFYCSCFPPPVSRYGMEMDIINICVILIYGCVYIKHSHIDFSEYDFSHTTFRTKELSSEIFSELPTTISVD